MIPTWRPSPYFQVARTSFLKLMAYRMRFVTGIATYCVFVGVHWLIWRAVYAERAEQGETTVGGLGFAQLATYLAVGYMARSAYFTNTDGEIAARFRNGEITIDLIRPIDFHANWLAQAAGETAFRILFFAMPMALVMAPLFGIQAPSGDGWWQFPLLFALAFFVNAELNLLAGTASFFLEDIAGLMSLKRNLLMVATGLMVPLHFLQPLIGDGGVSALTALPFAVIGYYPTLAWIGQLGVDGTREFSAVLGLAMFWLVALRLANILLWRRAVRRLEVQGG